MKILVVTSHYRMLDNFANRFYETLKPIGLEKKSFIKVSLTEDLRGRIDKNTKVIFLEDQYLLKELYDIKLFLEQRGCDSLYFNSICDNYPDSEGSRALKNYLLKP